MIAKIEQDLHRFKEIVRGRIKGNLKKYITSGELIGRQGEKIVSIPVPQVQLPRFEFGAKRTAAWGRGRRAGAALGAEHPAYGPGAGASRASTSSRWRSPSRSWRGSWGRSSSCRTSSRAAGEHQEHRGPLHGDLAHGPRVAAALQADVPPGAEAPARAGDLRPAEPPAHPVKEDRRYRSWKPVYAPQNNAAIIYIMDVSGSMGDEQKEIVGSSRSGSTPGSGTSTRGSTRATSSTTPPQGGGPGHLLHIRSRAGRHLLGVQVRGQDDRGGVPDRRVEPLRLPLLRRGTGPWTTRRSASAC